MTTKEEEKKFYEILKGELDNKMFGYIKANLMIDGLFIEDYNEKVIKILSVIDYVKKNPERYKEAWIRWAKEKNELIKEEGIKEKRENLSELKVKVFSNDEDLIEDLATERLSIKLYEKQIKYIDKKWDFELLKEASKKWFRQRESLKFYISKVDEVSGKIINRLGDTKEKISLIKVIKPKNDMDDVPSLSFFDDKVGKKIHEKIKEDFSVDFWMYQLVSKGKKYLVLSEDELDLEDYNIKGMIVEVQDYAEIGKNTTLAIQLPLLFVHSVKKRIIRFGSHGELLSAVRKYSFSEDKLFSWIFSDENGKYLPHPKEFERLISSQLFSASHGLRSYPLHILIIGEPGTGKSTMQDNIYWKYDEINPKTEASGSTFKSLVPSFKSSNAVQPGALALAIRLCMVDEFLRILMDVRPEDREMWFARLNPLLEHQKSNFGSGNASATLQMTSKLLSVSNPVWDTKTMQQLCSRIDPSFLGRLLIWYQDKDHVNMIQESEEEDIKSRKLTIPKELWISIIDYMQTFRAGYDDDKIKEIYNEGLETIRSDDKEHLIVKDIYKARYKHHIRCLIDGIVKVRCLCEGNSSFKAATIDYQNLEIIWKKMLSTWGYKKILVEKH